MQPGAGTFYQPLNADGDTDAMAWEQRLNGLAEHDVDTLYLQWTRHDRSTFGEQDGWLWRLLRQASGHGFALVLGLHAESSYFEHVNERFNAGYWSAYVARNLVWGERINAVLEQHAGLSVSGFYFPGELNDRVLADPATLTQVRHDLVLLQRRLQRPLYVSTYYTGYTSPTEYARNLQQLQTDDILVLHQDGAGTRALNKNQVDEVLLALDCQFGIIEELFVQRSDGEFDRLSEEWLRTKAAQRACHRRVFFSWRYISAW